jgi:hypothetical protein
MGALGRHYLCRIIGDCVVFDCTPPRVASKYAKVADSSISEATPPPCVRELVAGRWRTFTCRNVAILLIIHQARVHELSIRYAGQPDDARLVPYRKCAVVSRRHILIVPGNDMIALAKQRTNCMGRDLYRRRLASSREASPYMNRA